MFTVHIGTFIASFWQNHFKVWKAFPEGCGDKGIGVLGMISEKDLRLNCSELAT